VLIGSGMSFENGKVWYYQIQANNAQSLQIFFSHYLLPEGAKLFIYNTDYSAIYGAFTAFNNNGSNELMIADLPGDHLVIEYFEPNDALFEGILVIGEVGRSYMDIFNDGRFADENGFVNVNCHPGMDWQEQKHAVCRYTFKIGVFGYLCSGALINNTRNDGTPYFLTANHCIPNYIVAKTVVAYFNYEVLGCRGPEISYKTLSGANFKASGRNSDFTLLEFKNPPTPEYQPYFAGWDVSGITGVSSAGIHHPNGLRKKISIDTGEPESIAKELYWSDHLISPPNSHWGIVFDEGRTAAGSSGSPLFDRNKRIIGQLHGGNELWDYYGKLDYSWNNPDSKNTAELSAFLDPDQIGVWQLDGYYPPGNKPDVQLSPELTPTCNASTLKVFGSSAFSPVSYKWTFIPDDVEYINGTDQYSMVPEVLIKDDSGIIGTSYDIRLEITNSAGASERTFTSILPVSDKIEARITALKRWDHCLCSFDSLIFRANGAREYTWHLKDGMENNFDMHTSDDHLTIKPVQLPDSHSVITIQLEGRQGACTDIATLDIPLYLPSNDSIHNAIEIKTGSNPTSLRPPPDYELTHKFEFNNKCAHPEYLEPSPPASSICTRQGFWCDESGNGIGKIDNSVWFKYIPENSGVYAIHTYGADVQIAVYEARSTFALKSGYYELIGANDDISTDNYDASARDLKLLEGKTYYIQVDGSAGGETGFFQLIVEWMDPLPGVFRNHDQASIYPQPSTSEIFIEYPGITIEGTYQISVYSLSGKLELVKTIQSSNEQTLQLDIRQLTTGVHIMKVIQGDKTSTFRIMKK